MKFNSKTKGVNHRFNPSELELLLGDENKRENTIVFRSDVSHPGSGSLAGVPSVACVVASLDVDFQNYPGSMRLQAGGQENIEEMQAMVLERLEAWTQNDANQPKPDPPKGDREIPPPPPPPSKRLPTSILFHRDGLSESQFDQCMTHEVQGIKKAFRILAKNYKQPDAKLKLTFVVVGKRRHTRFFPKSAAESYGGAPYQPAQGNRRAQPAKPVNGNVKSGLLVGDVVTTPHAYNFYLQSHAAPAGTARSAHYHILLDEMNFGSTDRRLAKITNMFCYCFSRALKGVSYVASAYIADRMCERGRVWLRHWKPGPSFKLPATDNGGAWDKDEITQWKQRKALELSRSARLDGRTTERVWMHFNDQSQTPRCSPWHSALDDSMFWM